MPSRTPARVPFAVIDHWTARGFEEWVLALPPGPTGHVVVDFRAVDYLMAAGVRALVRVDERLGARGHRLTVVGVNRIVGRVLEVCDLADRWCPAPCRGV